MLTLRAAFLQSQSFMFSSFHASLRTQFSKITQKGYFMTNPIDRAHERLSSLQPEMEVSLLTQPNESDTRLKVWLN